jgi:hypothetical protein
VRARASIISIRPRTKETMMGNFGESFDVDKTKDDVAKHLEQRFPDHDAAELREVASETVDKFADAPVTGFIDTVAEHEATEQLKKADAAG